MHYSEKLKFEIELKESKLKELDNEVLELLKYLSSEKFLGFENNYVNANEMYNRVAIIRSIINS